jgi:exonuclease SbcC
VPDASSLESQAKLLTEQAASLDHLLAVERGLPARRTAADEATTRLAAVADSLEQNVSRQQGLALELVELRARQQNLASAAGRLAAASAEVTLWDQRREAEAKVATLTTKLAEARDTERDAIDSHQAARDAWQSLVQTRIDGMAGELAAHLRQGEACAVCGATEHPAPATPADKPVDQTMVDAARGHSARLEQVRMAAGQVREEVAADRTRELALTAGFSAQQIEEGLLQSRADLRAATQADLRRRNSRRNFSFGRTPGQSRATGRGPHNRRDSRLQTEQRNAEDALRSDEVAVAQAAGDSGTVAALVGESRDRAAALTNLAIAIRAAEQTERQRLSQVEVAAASARSAGFETLADAQSALLADDTLTDLRIQVEAWNQREQKLAGQLEGDRLAGLGKPTDADLQLAQEAEAATTVERARLEAEISVVTVERDTARTREARFGQLCADVETALAALHAEQAAHKPLLELDRLTRGMAGARRMTLTTYVLRYWFAQVVTAANLRLSRMSGGKYELSRIEAGSRQGARVGLGLAVFDRYTGKERSPGTLSGGETFYTSLALALGLADVVQAEAGGEPETLFIDGVRNLDATLEQVLTVIDGLRDTVGL